MAFGFVFNYKILSFAPSKLFGAGGLGVKMVLPGLAGDYFSIFGDFQPFDIRFVCFHPFHCILVAPPPAAVLSMVTVNPFGPLL